MKNLRTALVFLISIVVLSGVNQYFFCPRFTFPPTAPFHGSDIYNPYQSMQTGSWIKCNFHAHAQAWNGVTNGHGSAADIHNAYEALKYGVHCVSNYQYIDTTNATHESYIPAYEHGYNIKKTHQLILGDYRIEWLDYLLPQTIENKQHVLNQLKNPNSVVILNHPALRNGYLETDFASLSNFDCMEVLNPSVVSTPQWDAALSQGKKTFIVGNDDMHNVITKDRLGKICTFVNVRDNKREQVLKALKSGQSYGVIIGAEQHIDSIPFLKNFEVAGDTVTIEMSHPAQDFVITAQNGKVVQSVHNRSKATFILDPRDHYARATCTYTNGTKIFLNPVFYTNDKDIINAAVPENYAETLIYRTMGLLVLLLYVRVVRGIFQLDLPRYARLWPNPLPGRGRL